KLNPSLTRRVGVDTGCAAPAWRRRGPSEPMQLAVLAHEVHKGFGTSHRWTPILRGVSLGVARGEGLFMVGPAGSGQTALLSILGCILSPDSGSVQILGHDVARLGVQRLTAFRRQYLGFIFQTFNLFPNLSALDNIRLALTMRGVSLRDASERAADLLNQVG